MLTVPFLCIIGKVEWIRTKFNLPNWFVDGVADDGILVNSLHAGPYMKTVLSITNITIQQRQHHRRQKSTAECVSIHYKLILQSLSQEIFISREFHFSSNCCKTSLRNHLDLDYATLYIPM